MLTALREADRRKVLAREEHRAHGPFLCAACGAEMQIVKGELRVHHFRHRAESRACAVSRGESPQHLAAKEAVWLALRDSDRVSSAELEYPVGDTNVADVFARIDGFPVAIELQRSAITVEEMTARTLRYHDQGVFVLWLALLDEAHCFSRYAPAAWERWAHAAYGGRVYYWVERDVIQPIHYGPFRERVAERRWVSRDRVEEVAPAYVRTSKSGRTPEHGPRLSIAQDFTPRRRPAFEGGSVRVPRCSLFVDDRPAWWSPRA